MKTIKELEQEKAKIKKQISKTQIFINLTHISNLWEKRRR